MAPIRRSRVAKEDARDKKKASSIGEARGWGTEFLSVLADAAAVAAKKSKVVKKKVVENVEQPRVSERLAMKRQKRMAEAEAEAGLEGQEQAEIDAIESGNTQVLVGAGAKFDDLISIATASMEEQSLRGTSISEESTMPPTPPTPVRLLGPVQILSSPSKMGDYHHDDLPSPKDSAILLAHHGIMVGLALDLHLAGGEKMEREVKQQEEEDQVEEMDWEACSVYSVLE